MDVGQGDAILIQQDNYQILVDGGPDDSIMYELPKFMPWFDKKGMGIQYETIGGIKMTVKELVEQGYLRKVKK